MDQPFEGIHEPNNDQILVENIDSETYSNEEGGEKLESPENRHMKNVTDPPIK